MQREPVERIGITDQHRLDDWYDRAMRDETVRPTLTTGMHFPRLIIPEDDYDGAVLMNHNDTGVLKLYNDEESGTMKIGIWVLTPSDGDLPRGNTAFSLTSAALVIAKANPLIRYIGTRVMASNYHGMNYSDRLFDYWGREEAAVWDTRTVGTCPRPGRWVDWFHYRALVNKVEQNMILWEKYVDNATTS